MNIETIIQIIASLVSTVVYAAIIALIVLLCERRKQRSAKKTQTRPISTAQAIPVRQERTAPAPDLNSFLFPLARKERKTSVGSEGETIRDFRELFALSRENRPADQGLQNSDLVYCGLSKGIPYLQIVNDYPGPILVFSGAPVPGFPLDQYARYIRISYDELRAFAAMESPELAARFHSLNEENWEQFTSNPNMPSDRMNAQDSTGNTPDVPPIDEDTKEDTENQESADHASSEANDVHPSVLAMYRPVQNANLQYTEIDEKYAFQHFEVSDSDDIYGNILWLRVKNEHEREKLNRALSEINYNRGIGNEDRKRLRRNVSEGRQMLYFRISDPGAAKQIDTVQRYKYRMYGFHLICDWEGHPYRYYDFMEDHFYYDESISIPHALDDSPSEMRVQTRVFSDEEREQELEEAIRAGFITGDPHEIVEVPWGHATRAMAEYLSGFSFVKENDSPSYLFWGIYRIAKKGDLWCGDSADEKGNWGEGGFDSADINTAILGTLWIGIRPWSLSDRIAPKEQAGAPVFEETYRITPPMKREKLSEHVHCYIMQGEKGYDLCRASSRFEKAYRQWKNLSYDDAVKRWQSDESAVRRAAAFLDEMRKKGVIPDDQSRAELERLVLFVTGG